MARFLSAFTTRVNDDETEEDGGQADDAANLTPSQSRSNHNGAISYGDNRRVAHARRPPSHESNDRYGLV